MINKPESFIEHLYREKIEEEKLKKKAEDIIYPKEVPEYINKVTKELREYFDGFDFGFIIVSVEDLKSRIDSINTLSSRLPSYYSNKYEEHSITYTTDLTGPATLIQCGWGFNSILAAVTKNSEEDSYKLFIAKTKSSEDLKNAINNIVVISYSKLLTTLKSGDYYSSSSYEDDDIEEYFKITNYEFVLVESLVTDQIADIGETLASLRLQNTENW